MKKIIIKNYSAAFLLLLFEMLCFLLFVEFFFLFRDEKLVNTQNSLRAIFKDPKRAIGI